MCDKVTQLQPGAAGHLDAESLGFLAFVALAKWWAPVRTVVAWLGVDWRAAAPVRVHGFVDRRAAEAKLAGRPAGTFLLRFSESKAGKLVITGSFPRSDGLAGTKVIHYLLDVTAAGCRITYEDGAQTDYATLGELVMSIPRLTMLEPGILKADLFGSAYALPTAPAAPAAPAPPAFLAPLEARVSPGHNTGRPPDRPPSALCGSVSSAASLQ